MRFVVRFGQHGIARAVRATSLPGLKSQAEHGFANAELGALAEHGGADTFLFEESTVGGIEVAKIGVIFADFDDAMMARNFGILQGDVGALASDHDASLFQCVSSACVRA